MRTELCFIEEQPRTPQGARDRLRVHLIAVCGETRLGLPPTRPQRRAVGCSIVVPSPALCFTSRSSHRTRVPAPAHLPFASRHHDAPQHRRRSRRAPGVLSLRASADRRGIRDERWREVCRAQGAQRGSPCAARALAGLCRVRPRPRRRSDSPALTSPRTCQRPSKLWFWSR